MFDDRHLVLRERTGLVAADYLRAAESLYGGELSDDRVALRHVGDADGKHDRDDRRKSFRNRRDRETDRRHERRENGVKRNRFRVEELFAYSQEENDDADRQHEDRQDLAEFAEFLLERGFALRSLREHVGNFTHFGVHSRRHDDRSASSVGDRATHVDHVLAVAERHLFAVLHFKRVDHFVDRNALSGERGLFDLEAVALYDPSVRGNLVARFKLHNVSDNEVLAVDDPEHSVAVDLARRRRHLRQRLDRLFGLVLLVNSEDRVDDDDRHDYNDVREALAVDDGGDQRNCRRRNQNENHRVGHLLEKPDDERDLFLLGKLVLAVLRKSLLRLLLRKAFRGRVYFPQHIFD